MMATYAIGDIHGCFDELSKLLDLINYSEARDKLLFTGDLVNGGNKSVETLQFIKALGDKAICILGNHDLTLLALDKGAVMKEKRDPMQDASDESNKSDKYKDCSREILQHRDRKEILTWLSKRPLAYFDKEFNVLMLHAGLYPFWSVPISLELIREVEQVLHSDDNRELLVNMYGNTPLKWSENLVGLERLRFIINATTRMRFCDSDGNLELTTKGTIENTPQGYKPWFQLLDDKKLNGVRIIFGHWSALMGITNSEHAINLDTGCVWGNSLTALRLDDGKKFQVDCSQYCNY